MREQMTAMDGIGLCALGLLVGAPIIMGEGVLAIVPSIALTIMLGKMWTMGRGRTFATIIMWALIITSFILEFNILGVK